MWWNQCAIDRGKDFRGSNDRPIRFDPLRIAIDQLIDMRAEQDSETHQLLYHVDDPVIIARRLHPSGLVEFGIGFGHEIGRAHVRTPVTNAHLVCRLLLEKNTTKTTT